MPIREDPETFPFWTEPLAELGHVRIGLAEAFMEALEDEPVALDWLAWGGEVKRGDTVALLHTAHRSIDVRASFSFEVVRINEEAVRNPQWVRDSPYYRGWLAEVLPRA